MNDSAATLQFRSSLLCADVLRCRVARVLFYVLASPVIYVRVGCVFVLVDLLFVVEEPTVYGSGARFVVHNSGLLRDDPGACWPCRSIGPVSLVVPDFAFLRLCRSS